ncbi:hypothetical protein EKD04_017520 [Chloroflexales bacterium ZM16-3]|nr:hypothetical protein [Chloroflexales bacterium ZM16-3]
MAPTTTNLYDFAGITAQMIIGGKEPRFELLRAGVVEKVVPATRSWKAEQKAIIAEAEALAASGKTAHIYQLLLASAVPMSNTGAKPTRKATVLDAEENPDGSYTLTLRGGPSAAARNAELDLIGTYLLGNGVSISFRGGELVASWPEPGEDGADEEA